MKHYRFDSTVNRSGMDSLKEVVKPDCLRKHNLLSYWGAEFDFPTAPSLIEAVKNFSDRGLFGYTIPSRDYRERVAWWLKEVRSATIEEKWLVPTHGTIFSLSTALKAFTDPDDGVIVLLPAYNKYRQAADRLGRKIIECPLIEHADHYCINFKELENLAALDKNKFLILCNPNNPTGTVFGTEDLHKILDVAQKEHLTVFSDEIFAEISFTDNPVTCLAELAGQGSSVICSTSLGKTFSLTGVNHANVIIPNEKMRTEFTKQRDIDHYGSIDPMLNAAIKGAYSAEGKKWLDAMKAYIWDNYIYVKEAFAEIIPEVKIFKPDGTFILWIDFSSLGLDNKELESFLLSEAFLHMDHGDSYGGGIFFRRMNIAVPRPELRRSIEFLRKAVIKLR